MAGTVACGPGGALNTLSDITLIGRGRLGRSLHALLSRQGVTAHLIDSRGELPSLPADHLAVLCVADAAIGTVADALPVGPIVLHTSGATDLGPLSAHRSAGSLHPLMTFPGPELGLPDLDGVPAAVAGDEEALRAARTLARLLGLRPVHVPGDRRLYHAAAVLAGNGATILLGEARRVLIQAGVPQDEAAAMLVPLVLRSVSNAAPDPARALTGPIARGDRGVLDAHRAALHAADLDDIAELHRHLEVAGTRLVRSDTGRVTSEASARGEASETET